MVERRLEHHLEQIAAVTHVFFGRTRRAAARRSIDIGFGWRSLPSNLVAYTGAACECLEFVPCLRVRKVCRSGLQASVQSFQESF